MYSHTRACVTSFVFITQDPIHEFTIVNICNTGFNDAPNPKWGDRKLGLKTQRSIAKREAMLAAEAAKRARY